MVEKLPPDFEPLPVPEVTFFKAGDNFNLPYLNKEQETCLLAGQQVKIPGQMLTFTLDWPLTLAAAPAVTVN